MPRGASESYPAAPFLKLKGGEGRGGGVGGLFSARVLLGSAPKAPSPLIPKAPSTLTPQKCCPGATELSMCYCHRPESRGRGRKSWEEAEKKAGKNSLPLTHGTEVASSLC